MASVLPARMVPVCTTWHTQVSLDVADMWCPTQGSASGPILFILYTADLVGLVEQHCFRPHLYSDDTQVYGSYRPSIVADFQVHLSACVNHTVAWMLANHLKSIQAKTVLFWCVRHLVVARRSLSPSSCQGWITAML